MSKWCQAAVVKLLYHFNEQTFLDFRPWYSWNGTSWTLVTISTQSEIVPIHLLGHVKLVRFLVSHTLNIFMWWTTILPKTAFSYLLFVTLKSENFDKYKILLRTFGKPFGWAEILFWVSSAHLKQPWLRPCTIMNLACIDVKRNAKLYAHFNIYNTLCTRYQREHTLSQSMHRQTIFF